MTTVRVPKYQMGNGGKRQCARHPSGTWYVRTKGNPGWSAWLPVGTVRPDGAWYNPADAVARLPE